MISNNKANLDNNSRVQLSIKDKLILDDRDIPMQVNVQNWGLPFDREWLKEEVKIAITRDSLNISMIAMIDVSLELNKYSADKSPSGMEDIEVKVASKDGQIDTVVMSDRFNYTMENILIKITKQN